MSIPLLRQFFVKLNCKRRVAIDAMLFVAKKVKGVAHLFFWSIVSGASKNDYLCLI